MDLVKRLQNSYHLYLTRLRTDFENGFEGMLNAYRSGRGEDDPHLQGQRAVEEMREEVRGLIADVRFFGEEAVNSPLNETNKKWWIDNYGQERWSRKSLTHAKRQTGHSPRSPRPPSGWRCRSSVARKS
ncbi:hypothetical protein [Arvimicrobium flavum]|uniref:hypothetical protein n=1 Tax=Arvimicrobium flavum TaxID=3393320 RepID=UPI00237BAEE9|nr:hypothetical protein [Mesorhizobium shangrilense]